jgi:small subunit ribosomal protein S1
MTNVSVDTQTLEDQFAALMVEFDQQQEAIKESEITQGRVLAITKDHVLVDIGYKSEGIIDIREFTADGAELTLRVGDLIDVFVEEQEDEQGLCVLSKEKADKLKVWEDLSQKNEKDETVTGMIISRVKGGLQVDIGVRAFLPGSQMELRPTRNLDKFIGQTFDFKIIKFNKRRGNIVLSRRALLEKERERLKKETLKKLEENSVIDGIVKNITEYGAFVDLGGIDGLLHITDMSWGRITHPSEMFEVGQEVRVMVLKFNPDNERVSLGFKQLSADPWDGAEVRYPVDQRVQGRVVSLIDYGAFVELEEGIEGLIHISEMSWTKRIKHPNQVVKVNDVVECVVLSIDSQSKKISLGMKQIEPNPWTLLEERYPVGTVINGKVRNITDFGIFVGIEDGIDGLVHISDLSWTQKVRHPSEVYKKGDEVQAVVLNIDVENERFSLGIKQLTPDPWEDLPDRFPPGTITDAVITKLTDFGAFAEIENGIEGLIHISEISVERVDDPAQAVKVGDNRKVEIISIDPKERKIALSIKSFIQRSERGHLRQYADSGSASVQLGDLFKDKLGDLMGE